MASLRARIREANAAGRSTKAGWQIIRSRFDRKIWRLKIKDYGEAEFRVRLGDADGSGEAPCVQIEFEHEFSGGPKAVALSGREVDALRKVLELASKRISPYERARARYRHVIQKEL